MTHRTMEFENRAYQRERKGCDLCKQDKGTWKFESMDAYLALWLCDGCYEVLTGDKP